MDVTFTKEDVRQHLEELGYKNIPDEKLKKFLKDLRRLIKHEDKKRRIDEKLKQLESKAERDEPPNTSSSLDSASQLQAKLSPRKSRRVKRLSETQQESRARKPAAKPPHVTVSLNEESFGASYEESGTSSASSSSAVSTSRSLSSGQRTEERDSPDFTVGEDSEAKEDSSLYIDVNLHRSRSTNSLAATLLERPSSGFIRCRSDNALQTGVGRRDLRSDPVRLHQKYRESWAKHSLPGESSHNKLRWAVREWMMGEEPV